MKFHKLCFAAIKNIMSIITLLKAIYSSKDRHFFIQERFNKLIHGINMIIKCGI